MLNRSARRPEPNQALPNSDFHYYLGVFEGGPLMKGLEAVFEKSSPTFKLAFLAFANLKMMEQEIDQAASSGRPVNKLEHFKNAATAFTSAATTVLLTVALENSLGWWAAPTLMVGGKLLVDTLQGKGPKIREQLSVPSPQRYYDNLSSWWNRRQPVAARTLETANNNNRQFRV